jgi:hypothetical protein
MNRKPFFAALALAGSVSVHAALVATPATLDFGGQLFGAASPPRVVTLSNTGTSALTVTGITVSPSSYTVSHACGTIPAGGICSASVTFTPSTQFTITGTFSATSGAGAASVSLNGVGERALTTHYYRSILRRAPDAGGKAFWERDAARMSGLGADINEAWYAMAMSFFNSPEYAQFGRDNDGFVTDLYLTFFNRTPDPGGFAFWKANLEAGMPREVLLASFMFSPEFVNFTRAIFGDTGAWAEVNTVMDFYRGLLGRGPDTGGFEFWVQRFRDAQCSGAGSVYAEVDAISSAFINSAEYAGRQRSNAQFVGDLYNAFLRRGGELAGVQFWIGQLASGAQSRDQVRQAFIASAEFNARVNAIIDDGCDASSGFLSSAVFYLGNYPPPEAVTYTASTGLSATSIATPGQVQVFFNPSVPRATAEAVVEAAGGVVGGKIPKLGYFLALVTPGNEGAFIAAMRARSDVIGAQPNADAQAAQVAIDESWVRTNRPVPLNIRSGVIVIDTRSAGDHGSIVTSQVTDSGAAVGGRIRAEDQNGRMTADSVLYGLSAATAGRSIFTPNDPIVVNISISGGGANTCDWGAGCGDSAAMVAQRHVGFQNFLGGILDGIDRMPLEVRSRLLVTNALGNGSALVTNDIQALRTNAARSRVLDENMILVMADQTIPFSAARPNGRYSNRAMDNAVVNYDGIVRDASGNMINAGTSFAAPRIAAFSQQTLVAVPGLGVSQAKQAVIQAIQANPTGTFVLNEAVTRAQQIMHPAPNVCDSFTCYNQCFNAYLACYGGCGTGIPGLQCLSACDRTFAICPSTTNLATCACTLN